MISPGPDARCLAVYEIDALRRIVSVDEAWCAFARENGAPQYADPASIYGRPLLSFISDPATRLIYDGLIGRVVSAQVPVTVTLRCDAPALERWLELDLLPTAGEGVRFRSRQLKTRPRQPPIEIRDRRSDAPGRMVLMCSWCKNVATPRGWASLEDAVAALDLFHEVTTPEITHGMCEPCAQKFMSGGS